MRIAYLTPEFVTEPYFSGGLANYVNRLGLALARDGHDIHVLVRAAQDGDPFDHHGATVHRVAPMRPVRYFDVLDLGKVPDTAAWLGFSRAVSRRVKALNAEAPFDLVQASNSRGCGLFTALRTSLPVLTRISCFRPLWNRVCRIPRGRDEVATEWVELLQMRISRGVFAPSKALARVIEHNAHIPRVPVVPTPMYLETPNEDDTAYREHCEGMEYILYVGRYQEHKGFHILAQAMSKILDSQPNLGAVFVGADAPGMGRPSMAGWARETLAPYADRLRFIGQTPHSRLYPIIRRAKLVVLPSLVDNLPNTCLEAMALGRPVLGTRGASFEELIDHGVNGFLTLPNDPGQLARAMAQALSHPNLETVGRAARASMDRLAPENTLAAHLALYREILAAHPPTNHSPAE